MNQTEDFYKSLHPYASLEEVTAGIEPVELPSDWWVVVADVEGSTAAIERGEYKAVNTVGAATIVAVVNINRDVSIPYVFGGDGTTCAVPPSFELKTRRALLGARDLAKTGFGLTLRTGMIRVDELKRQGHAVKIAKYRLSPDMNQPALFGQGWDVAEDMLKHPRFGASILIEESKHVYPEADFTGFECRWQGIKARHDHKLSLLVLGLSSQTGGPGPVYTEVWAKIKEIYGKETEFHPVSIERLKLALNYDSLKNEVKVRTNSFVAASVYYFRLCFLLAIGRILFHREKDTAQVKWSRYRQDLIANTDFRKFDGMLKMVIDGTEMQKKKLVAYLDQEVQAGRLIYGAHTSKEALLTCLIFDYNQDHIHFLDGGDGGYAMAAKQLKKSLRRHRDRLAVG